MNRIFVYGSLCNYTQLKEVLGRIPQNYIGTLNGFKRNNTATWKFYKNSKKNNKWRIKMGNGQKLQEEYSLRFSGLEEYRKGVWKILCNDIFQKYVPQDSKVLDIGSGYGDEGKGVFTNQLSMENDKLQHLILFVVL